MPETSPKSSKGGQSKTDAQVKADEAKAKSDEHAKVEEQTKVEEPVVEETPDEEAEPTFTVERLSREGRAITGRKPADIAGAFHGVDPGEEFTARAATARVDEWLGTVVSK